MINSVIPHLNELWVKYSLYIISVSLSQREKDIEVKDAEVWLYTQTIRQGVMRTRRLRMHIHTNDFLNMVSSPGKGRPDITRALTVSAVGRGYGVCFQLLDPDFGQH